MLAALFKELPNLYLFVGFSLFCGTCIFLWVSQLPKIPPLQNRPWGMDIPWVDFGLLLVTCLLVVVLAQTGLVPILKALKPDELESAIYNTFFFQGAILAAILLLRWKSPRLYGESLDRPGPRRTGNLCLATLGYFVKFMPLLWLASFLLIGLYSLLDYKPEPQKLVSLMAEASKARPLTFACLAFGAVILAPVVEEILFRGYIHRFLRAKFTLPVAALGSSALFALIHFSVHAFVPLFLLSLLLSFVYERTGKILAPIVFHALYNAQTVSLILLQSVLPKTNF